MKLIADCGATKIDWLLTDKGVIVDRRVTDGINFSQSGSAPLSILLESVAAENIDEVYFYGAGCRGFVVGDVEGVIQSRFPEAYVEVASDMLAAARALCGNEDGIACILGTGSNSCLYNGKDIIDNVPAMGYVLGDEGSGAVLGRNLLNMIFKRRIDSDVAVDFAADFPLSLDEIIRRVYRSDRPAAFLASFAPFIASHLNNPAVEEMVIGAFVDFFNNNVKAYRGYDKLPINFIGSVAAHFSSQLAAAASITGCRMGIVEVAPGDRLASYHG